MLKANALPRYARILVVFAAPLLIAAAPVERRLHSDRVEASSFLWNDWNRFQENYHPLYIADDDPRTVWVEGESGSGAGEWIRIRVTPLDGTSRVRLRVRNGYQKSKALYKANARIRTVELKLLPSGVIKKASLKDVQGWQDMVIQQAMGRVEAVEMRVVSVYEGKKYADLCISDVQVFATATSPDNPAFEKSKRERVISWKRERADAAKLFQSQADKAMPLAPQYRFATTEGWTAPAAVLEKIEDCQYDGPCLTGALLEAAHTTLASHRGAIEVAQRAYASKFSGWRAIQLADQDKRVRPAIDGLDTPDLYWSYEGPPGSGFELPIMNTMGLLGTERLGMFELENAPSLESVLAAEPRDCKKAVSATYAWTLPAARSKGTGEAQAQAQAISGERQRTRALLLARCGTIEVREGTDTTAIFQLLVYDDAGRLELVAGNGYVSTYEWRQDPSAAVISGGRRLSTYGSGIEHSTLAEASPFLRK